MSQYRTQRTEIRARIRAAWGADFKISNGRPKVPFSSAPYAVISLDPTLVSRQEGRQVFWTWSWNIVGVFPFDGDQDSEDLAMENAELLHQELEPFNDDGTVPSPEGPFAGICDQHFVTGKGPMEEGVEDGFVGCFVSFVTETHVHA